MTYLITRLYMLRHDTKGATAIEYGLIATLVSVVIIGALEAVGGHLTDAFTAVSNALTAP